MASYFAVATLYVKLLAEIVLCQPLQIINFCINCWLPFKYTLHYIFSFNSPSSGRLLFICEVDFRRSLKHQVWYTSINIWWVTLDSWILWTDSSFAWVWNTYMYNVRPDTSRRQRRQLPPCPLVIALVPLKCSSRNLQFPHRVPFTKEKMPWCPYPFKNEAYRPAGRNCLS